MSPTTAFDLWTLPVQLDGNELRAGEPQLFLQTPFFEVYPTFSPDGRWIAYASNKSGVWEVYVRAFPDRSAEVQISTGGGRVPRWPQGGHEIFYGTSDQRIVTVAYTIRGATFKAGTPRIWSDKRLGNTGVFPNFDVAPNGNRVAAMLPGVSHEEREGNQAIFLLNFFDEVRRRVGE